MANFARFNREVRTNARARRNANRLATLASSLAGNGIGFDSQGELTIILDPDADNLLVLAAAGLALLEADILAALHADILKRTLGS